MVYPILDKNNQIDSFASVRFDITEQVKAKMLVEERAQILSKSENLLSNILSNLPVIIFGKDIKNDFSVNIWNKKAENFFGISSQDIIGKRHSDFFPPEQADFFKKKDIEAINSKGVIDIPEETVSTAAGFRQVHTRIIIIRDNNGDALTLLGISEDITIKLAEEAKIKDLIDRNEAILASARFAIITVDATGIISGFNKEAERFIGRNASEIIEVQNITAFHMPNEVVEYAKELSEQFGVEVPSNFETLIFKAKKGEFDERQWTYIRADGPHVQVRLTITALRDNNGVIYGYLGIAKDITEELLNKSELDLAKLKSAQSAKMASLGEMSAAIAHEINNPIMMIEGTINLLNKYINDPENYAKKIDNIIMSCKRITKIVGGLKKFSRTGSEAILAPHNLCQIVNEVLELISNPNVTVDFKTDLQILCDEIEIEQVLINLINNATQAAKDSPDPWVKISIFEKQSYVVLWVENSGPLIPDEIRFRIFEPFFTTKAIGKGTGLGLWISKGILDEHHASFELLSGRKNTCFEIKFNKIDASKII